MWQPVIDMIDSAYSIRQVEGCDHYEDLVGPDGIVCTLSEPEDRSWGRDLTPVLTLLNNYHADLENARSEICRMRARLASISY